MIYNNDKDALHARDMELWYHDENDYENESELCEHCGEILEEGYYDINNSKLCEACAKLEFRECFDELEDLEELKKICEYDSEEELIADVIDDDLYKYWKRF